MDIDDLLAMVENPTRRRILEALVNGPSYPLRLSKELGVSQQAVMKNLVLMERNGMVASYRESSSMGPDRTVYVPSAAFTLVVDMQGGMFSVRLLPPSDEDAEEPEPMRAEEAMERITEIDDEIRELERRRSELIRERGRLLSAVGGADEKTERAEIPLRR
ncbi:MAG: helix-turn-helix domain-containing protein [Candidatus Methanomethylophilaceae archaeon]|nr:helix-turn-helix domain-containing protein [Candidatus Methanomethylophilaceae archaeon]